MMKKCLMSAALVLSVQATSSFAQNAVISAPPVDPALAAEFLAADTAFAARDVASVGDAGAAALAYPQVEANLLPFTAYEGLANTITAETTYAAIIPRATGDDLVRAVDGLYRSKNYQGVRSPLTYTSPAGLVETAKEIERKSEVLRKVRKSVFNNCWDKAITPISPEVLGTKIPEYYYYRAACLSREAEASTVLERLLSLPKLLGTFTDGAEVANIAVFEGGGLDRVQAAVKGNPAAKGLPGGLYNPTEALRLINSSIDSAASDATSLKTVEGFLYCENYYRKIMTLDVLEQKAEAKALVLETIDTFASFDSSLVPEQIRAENNYCIGEITKLGATL